MSKFREHIVELLRLILSSKKELPTELGAQSDFAARIRCENGTDNAASQYASSVIVIRTSSVEKLSASEPRCECWHDETLSLERKV